MSASMPCVGIDVSKARLDVAIRPCNAFMAHNDRDGIRDLVPWLCDRAVRLVVLVATGGLALPILANLAAAGLSGAVLPPGCGAPARSPAASGRPGARLR